MDKLYDLLVHLKYSIYLKTLFTFIIYFVVIILILNLLGECKYYINDKITSYKFTKTM